MYVVQGLPALGVETVTIQSIEEGYRYSGEGDRAVLTPCGPSPPTRGPSCWTAPAER